MFGKVFGYYEGVIPVLVVSDLDMLQEMFIKKFDCFYARKTTNLIHGNLECSQEEPRVNLFAARGARWKRLRALASPAFSVKALKQVIFDREYLIFLILVWFFRFMKLWRTVCLAWLITCRNK